MRSTDSVEDWLASRGGAEGGRASGGGGCRRVEFLALPPVLPPRMLPLSLPLWHCPFRLLLDHALHRALRELLFPRYFAESDEIHRLLVAQSRRGRRRFEFVSLIQISDVPAARPRRRPRTVRPPTLPGQDMYDTGLYVRVPAGALARGVAAGPAGVEPIRGVLVVVVVVECKRSSKHLVLRTDSLGLHTSRFLFC
jgi:hypothetical protein